MSTEEMGRKIRYEAFQQILGERKGRIAVAHNSNDRAETMLFHLFRGTGLAGVCGIRPVQGEIIRPLLFLERKSNSGCRNRRFLSVRMQRIWGMTIPGTGFGITFCLMQRRKSCTEPRPI